MLTPGHRCRRCSVALLARTGQRAAASISFESRPEVKSIPGAVTEDQSVRFQFFQPIIMDARPA